MKKKMKSVVVMVLGFVLAGAVLAGCGEKKQEQQDTQQSAPADISQETEQDSEPEKAEAGTTEKAEAETGEKAEAGTTENVESETAGKETQPSQVYEDNFAVDSAAAKEFAERIKDAAAQKDLEALADLTAFPVYVGLPDVDVVETREDFLKLGAESVFTDELLESVEKADIEDLQPSMAGFSISDGGTANINFGVVDGALAINGINY